MYEELVELLGMIFKEIFNMLKGNGWYVFVDVFMSGEDGDSIMLDVIFIDEEGVSFDGFLMD